MPEKSPSSGDDRDPTTTHRVLGTPSASAPVTRSGPTLVDGVDPDDGLATLGLGEPRSRRELRQREQVESGATQRRRRRRWIAVTAWITGVVVGLPTVGALFVAGYLGHIASTYGDRTTTIEQAFPAEVDRPVADETGALNVLLLGSDTREAGAAGRSDSMMLVHLPADRRAAYVMSIMRDSWVDVPGHGMAKINAAYSWGGVPLTVQTVEQLLQVRVDHVAEIDFAGFQAMTDALGGVDVVSEKAFTVKGHDFVAGPNHLDGRQALDFVRARHPFADADHQRVRNQQAFMRGLIDGVVDRGTLSSPAAVSDFVGAVTEHLSVDPGLTFGRLVEIGWGSRSLSPSAVQTFTLPTAGGGVAADGQSYVQLDVDALYPLREALQDDTLGEYLTAPPAPEPAVE
jgi:LCP family protein required for cell wall assembly